MGLQIYINGKMVNREDAKISIFDHGFLYGDGVFEGIRSYNGRIFKLKEHIDRLYRSAKAIMLQIPISKEELIQDTLMTVRTNKIRDGYIRLIVTRGVGDLGLDPRKCKELSIVIIADKVSLYPKELYEIGLEVITVPTRRNIHEAISPSIKSLNYLNNILAKIEANNAGFSEAIMLNSDGYVCEATGENIFIVKENKLITPPTWAGILEGITRNQVMEIAKEKGIDCCEDVLTRYDLYNAQECFLTGTAAEIVPIIKIDGRQIGNGKPGHITLQLTEMFHQLTQREGIDVY